MALRLTLVQDMASACRGSVTSFDLRLRTARASCDDEALKVLSADPHPWIAIAARARVQRLVVERRKK